MPSPEEARAAAERAARTSYGRLVALLAAPTRDLALAEDALADAFERALRTWPENGIPGSPEGWLLTVARHRQSDLLGSAAATRTRPLDVDPGVVHDLDPDAVGDKRLELLFACAHPAVDRAIRTPLMLQVVLGFDADQVGAAFAVPGLTMAQRLVRAKRRIKDAGIPFAVPDRSRMPGRLGSVLEAVYGCYAIDWRGTSAPTVHESMAAEARYLADTLTTLLPEEPEVWGLAALITLSLARAGARTEDFVPLDEQDTALWSRPMIAQGEEQLRRAGRVRAAGRVGRFELEAAIQAVHAERAETGTVDWPAVRTLYAALVEIAPTLGARVALAAATGRVDGPRSGLSVLDGIEDPGAGRFQPYWATRAGLLALAEDPAAASSYEKAISLTTDAQVRAWLGAQLADQPGGHSSASSA
ncbi:MAG: hypothetical protein J7518_22220 [Nocardioidaceae bacterium]|nr:hypothetical protein [Nocardioidaceae bacterium]